MAVVEVRHAERADAEAVAVLNAYVHELHVDAEPDEFRPTDLSEVRTFFEFIIGAPSHVVLVATAEERPVGYLWVEEHIRPANPFKNATHVLSLNHIAVDPEFRRRGVGRDLYAAAEAEARHRGIERIVMDHWTFNVDAAAFFGSLGFERFNVRMRKEVPK